MKCRFCHAPVELPFIDLGIAPPSNAFLTLAELSGEEKVCPLRVRVCEQCWLVQTEDFAEAHELFSPNYVYFSGFSSTWLDHCRQYVLAMVERFGLDRDSHVVEIAANDGYLLQYVQALNIPCTGIEPTASTAAAARAKGLSIIEKFFGRTLARDLVGSGHAADLTAANNVLAHVPDINDFVAGFAILLKPDGVSTFEFPHLLELVKHCQFDTIYHEHYSYLSLTAVERIFAANGLHVFDVERLATHGGSLRVYAQRSDTGARPLSPAVESLLRDERNAGMCSPGYYREFAARAERVRDHFRAFLAEVLADSRTVAAYGAAAKGNTLLNYAGVDSSSIAFVVDRNPSKQGLYLPGSHIPVVPLSVLQAARPDYVVILPWNLKTEIISQLESELDYRPTFVTAIPDTAQH